MRVALVVGSQRQLTRKGLLRARYWIRRISCKRITTRSAAVWGRPMCFGFWSIHNSPAVTCVRLSHSASRGWLLGRCWAIANQKPSMSWLCVARAFVCVSRVRRAVFLMEVGCRTYASLGLPCMRGAQTRGRIWHLLGSASSRQAERALSYVRLQLVPVWARHRWTFCPGDTGLVFCEGVSWPGYCRLCHERLLAGAFECVSRVRRLARSILTRMTASGQCVSRLAVHLRYAVVWRWIKLAGQTLRNAGPKAWARCAAVSWLALVLGPSTERLAASAVGAW